MGKTAKPGERSLAEAIAFVRAHPNCCRVTEPAYSRENWNGDLMDGYGIEDGHWIFDVQIRKHRHSNWDIFEVVEVASGQCAETQSVWRG